MRPGAHSEPHPRSSHHVSIALAENKLCVGYSRLVITMAIANTAARIAAEVVLVARGTRMNIVR